MEIDFIFICAIACSLVTGSSSYDLTQGEMNKILLEHNRIREEASPSASKMVYLKWNIYQQSQAMEKATELCRETNAFWQVKAGDYWLAYQAVESAEPSVIHMIDTWYKTKAFYKSDGTCYGSSEDCQPYKQIMMEDVKNLACALNKCPETYIFACIYSEKVQPDKRPYTIGEPCSACSSDRTLCINNLCVERSEKGRLYSLYSNPIYCLKDCTTCHLEGLGECRDCVCKNGGVRAARSAGCECDCAPGFYGQRCDVEETRHRNSIIVQLTMPWQERVAQSILESYITPQLKSLLPEALNSYCLRDDERLKMCCPGTDKTVKSFLENKYQLAESSWFSHEKDLFEETPDGGFSMYFTGIAPGYTTNEMRCYNKSDRVDDRTTNDQGNDLFIPPMLMKESLRHYIEEINKKLDQCCRKARVQYVHVPAFATAGSGVSVQAALLGWHLAVALLATIWQFDLRECKQE